MANPDFDCLNEVAIDFCPDKRMFVLKLYERDGSPVTDMLKYRKLEKALDSLFGFTCNLMRIVFSREGDPVALWLDAR